MQSRSNPWRDPNFQLVAKSKFNANQPHNDVDDHIMSDALPSENAQQSHAAASSSSSSNFDPSAIANEDGNEVDEHILLPLCSLSPETEAIPAPHNSMSSIPANTNDDDDEVIDLTGDDDPPLPIPSSVHKIHTSLTKKQEQPSDSVPSWSMLSDISSTSAAAAAASTHPSSAGVAHHSLFRSAPSLYSSSITSTPAVFALSAKYAIARQGVELAANIQGVVRVMGGWVSFHAKESVSTKSTNNETENVLTRCTCPSKSCIPSSSSSSTPAAASSRTFTLKDLPDSTASSSNASASSAAAAADPSLCCYCRYRSSNTEAFKFGTKFECPLDFFLRLYGPESVSPRQACWISISNSSNKSQTVEDEDSMDPEKEEALIEEWERSTVKTAERIQELAIKYRYTTGKFMVFPMACFNSMWSQVASAIALHRLEGVRTAKISPARDMIGPTGVLCIYTRNFMDRTELLRVRECIRVNCGMQKKLTYKPDIYTTLGIYSKNPYKIKASIGAF